MTASNPVQTFVRRNRGLVAAAVLLLVVILLIVVLPAVLPDPRAMDPMRRLAAASAEHPLGTDNYGRDLLSRLVAGGQASLLLATAVAVSATVLGLVIAIAAGFSKVAEAVLMRIMDAWMAFPAIVLAMALAIAFGASAVTEYVALTIIFTPGAARIFRARVIGIASREFIESARASGMGTLKLVFVHVLPHTIPLVLVQLTILMALCMLIDGGLSFLGLGIAPPTPTWGNMIAEGRAYMTLAPLLIIAPGLAIVLCVTLLNIIGNGLRPLLDPEIRVLVRLQHLRTAQRNRRTLPSERTAAIMLTRNGAER